MKAKILIVVLLAASLLIGSVLGADALCYQYGKITRMSAAGTSTSPSMRVDIRPLTSDPNATYYHYFDVNRIAVVNLLSAAFAANHTVYLQGDALTCPTTGTARYGGYVNSAWGYNTR